MPTITNCNTRAASTSAIAMDDQRASVPYFIVSSFQDFEIERLWRNDFLNADATKIENRESRFATMLARSIKAGLFENVEMNMASASERHTRPEIVGSYRIIWARSTLTKEVSYRVYFKEAIDPMSEHATKAAARAAAKRYSEADARREKQRSRGIETRLTEHLESLGVLGPLPQ